MASLTSRPLEVPEGSSAAALGPAVCVRPCRYGRGVFATRKIHKDELFDWAPVVRAPWPAHERPEVNTTMMSDYVYAWVDGGGPQHEDVVASALGLGSMYNHSFEPNALYVRRKDENRLDYVALRDIEAGEEILINYNGNPTDRTPLWFPTF